MEGKKNFYGRVYADVMRDKNISVTAKGIYAYLAAMCGASDECFPSVNTITTELGISKDTFYKHLNCLIAAGVVEKRQSISKNGRFSHTVYHLKRDARPYTKNTDAVKTVNENLGHTVNEFTGLSYPGF